MSPSPRSNRAGPSDGSHVFDRILCGVDGSNQAMQAARQATRLAVGPVLFVACVDVTTARRAGGALAGQMLEHVHAEAAEALRQAKSIAPDSMIRNVSGQPATILLRLAQSEGTTLLAIGSSWESRAAGAVFGSVATAVLHEAPCPVLIARAAAPTDVFPRRVIVGLDGSAQSADALAVGRELGRRLEAEVQPLVSTGGRGPRADVDLVRELADDVKIDKRGPVTALCDAASNADLVVLGSRGLRGLRTLGSVSERVAHKATSSVLTVR